MKIKKLSKFRYPRRKQRGISAKFPPSATDNFSPQENLIKRFSVPQNPKRILSVFKSSAASCGVLNPDLKITIIIPLYNEKDTFPKILKKIKNVDLGKLDKEIIIIDDNSSDGSKEELQKIKKSDITIMFNKRNRGKGYCIKRAIKYATGDLVIFQDADLEYDPKDYNNLIKPILEEECEVVYGSRFLDKGIKGELSFYFGNRLLSLLTSIFFLRKITDMETCYKVIPLEILKKIDLKSNDFAIEPEITAKILKKKIKIKEVPINYYPRTVKQGKKIKIKDGFIALKTLVKYRF